MQKLFPDSKWTFFFFLKFLFKCFFFLNCFFVQASKSLDPAICGWKMKTSKNEFMQISHQFIDKQQSCFVLFCFFSYIYFFSPESHPNYWNGNSSLCGHCFGWGKIPSKPYVIFYLFKRECILFYFENINSMKSQEQWKKLKKKKKNRVSIVLINF